MSERALSQDSRTGLTAYVEKHSNVFEDGLAESGPPNDFTREVAPGSGGIAAVVVEHLMDH